MAPLASTAARRRMERGRIWKQPPNPAPLTSEYFARRVSDTLPIFFLVFNDPIRQRPGAPPPQGSVADGSHVAARAGNSAGIPRVAGRHWRPSRWLWERGLVRGAEDCGPGSWPGGGCRGRRARAGRAAGGVRGEGAGRGQRAGSRRCVSGYAARPSHPQLGRGGPGGLGPSPAVCISLAGGGAWVERNRLHLEHCLFFLTSQRRQTTPKARRPDPAEPSLGRGSGPQAARRGGRCEPPPGECARVPSRPDWGKGRGRAENDFLPCRKTYFLLSQLP